MKILADCEMNSLRKHFFCHKCTAKSEIRMLDTKIGESGRKSSRNVIFPKNLEEENMSYYTSPNLKLLGVFKCLTLSEFSVMNGGQREQQMERDPSFSTSLPLLSFYQELCPVLTAQPSYPIEQR